MTQKRYFDYHSPRSTQLMNEKFNDIFSAGVYEGMKLEPSLGEPNKIVYMTAGKLLTSEGIAIVTDENETIGTIALPTATGGGDPRWWVATVVCEYTWDKYDPDSPTGVPPAANFKFIYGNPYELSTEVDFDTHAPALSASQTHIGHVVVRSDTTSLSADMIYQQWGKVPLSGYFRQLRSEDGRDIPEEDHSLYLEKPLGIKANPQPGTVLSLGGHAWVNASGRIPTSDGHLASKEYVDLAVSGGTYWNISGTDRIQTDSKAGVQVTDPTAILHVGNGDNLNGYGTEVECSIIIGTPGANHRLMFDNNEIQNVGSHLYIASQPADGEGTGGDIVFKTANVYTESGSISDKMRIMGSNGRVAIGNSNPQAELHVTGQVRCDTLYLEDGELTMSDLLVDNITLNDDLIGGSAEFDNVEIKSTLYTAGSGAYAKFHKIRAGYVEVDDERIRIEKSNGALFGYMLIVNTTGGFGYAGSLGLASADGQRFAIRSNALDILGGGVIRFQRQPNSEIHGQPQGVNIVGAGGTMQLKGSSIDWNSSTFYIGAISDHYTSGDSIVIGTNVRNTSIVGADSGGSPVNLINMRSEPAADLAHVFMRNSVTIGNADYKDPGALTVYHPTNSEAIATFSNAANRTGDNNWSKMEVYNWNFNGSATARPILVLMTPPGNKLCCLWCDNDGHLRANADGLPNLHNSGDQLTT